jgi:glycosyltransferase involved in cell wall biosynthesis/tetratricopeptide (TPR) repeat protein
MPPPPVDIIIPCYNTGRYLRQAIDSALAQTYPNINILVVDDGSTDDTKEIVGSYEGAVHYHYQENKGLPAARNAGIRRTESQYVSLLDADDIILPSKVSCQAEYLDRHPDVDIVFGDTLLVFGNQIDRFVVDWRPFREWDDYVDPFSMMCAFQPHAPMVRRRVFEKHGLFAEEMTHGCEDWEFWLRCVLEGAVINHMAQFQALYRKHAGSMTAEITQLERQETAMIRRAAAMFDRYAIESEPRRRMLSCGMRFIAARCVRVGKIDEYAELVELSRMVVRGSGITDESAHILRDFGPNAISLLYLVLTKELVDLGKPELAAFCWFHTGDARTLRDQARATGFGRVFDSVVEFVANYLHVTPRDEHTDHAEQSSLNKRLYRNNAFSDLEGKIRPHWSFKAYLWHGLAILSEADDQFDEAIDMLATANHLNPFHYYGRLDLGRILEKKGDYVGAEQEFRAAVAIDPTVYYGRLDLGRILEKKGDYVGAEQEFRAAVAIDPTVYYGRLDLGRILEKKGDYVGAEQELKRTIALDSKLVDGHIYLVGVLRKMGKNWEAATRFLKAARIDPARAADYLHTGLSGHCSRLPGAGGARLKVMLASTGFYKLLYWTLLLVNRSLAALDR